MDAPRTATLDEYSITVAALDRAIARSLEDEDEATKEQILAKLPPEYVDLADVFSKLNSDSLAPFRSSDHRIELLPDAPPL